MDFETCFFECCKACNCLNENFQLPREIQGQGDCNSSIGVQDDQNVWLNADREKKLKGKLREKDKSTLTAENRKGLHDFYCDCVKKTDIKQNLADKYNHETKLENKNSNVFEDSNNPWNFPYASWNNSKTEKIYVSEDPNPYISFKSDKALAKTVRELKEKVDILFQIFRDCVEKTSSGDYQESSQIKAPGAGANFFGDFWHLFDFNKRLSATEEGIEKLTFIIEDLLNKWNKKKLSEDITYRNPLPFEEMTIGERINFLKTRNDLLLSLMRHFFKVGSFEEICSRLALLPKKSEVNQVFLGSELQYNDKSQGHCLSKEELIDTLKKLRTQFTKIQENKSQSSNQLHSARNERRENSLKYFGSKLEVISEQAELALNNESENTDLDNLRKKNFQNMKENFPSGVSEKSGESDINMYEVTSRLLAQEALLKSSLDKVHFELFSKLDTSEKKYAKGNLNVVNKTEIPKKEENHNYSLETKFGSAGLTRESGCIYCDSEYSEKSKSNETTVVDENLVKQKELNEPIKETDNSFESVSENLPKHNPPVSNKKTDEYQESKPKTFRKTLHKNSFTILSPASKAKRTENCLPERCSSSREGTKNEVEVKDKRPVTAPNSLSKIMPPSGLKSPVTEKSRRKNLGLNNVKNKNKSLLSKKSFVETS